MVGIYFPHAFIFPLAILSIPLTLYLPGASKPSPSKPPNYTSNDSTFHDSTRGDSETDPLLASTFRYSPDSDTETADSLRSKWGSLRTQSRMRQCLDSLWAKANEFYSIFASVRMAWYAYGSMLVVTLGKQSLHILMQYVSKRFGMTIAEVSE